MHCLLLIVSVLCYGAAGRNTLSRKSFITLHKWTELRMTLPMVQDVPSTADAMRFSQDKLLPVDVDIEYGDDGYYRTFMTIPRLSHGIPYSLAVVADSDNATQLNPKLQPYPSYDWHASYGRNCSAITSAIRTYIDECWRLWVVDLGQINSLQYCAPQILAFDLVSDRLVHRYTIPASLYTPGVSIFTALLVDVAENDAHETQCVDSKVYISDPWGYGLIVYDTLLRKSWRIQNAFMRPDQHLTQSTSSNSGIFTVSISPKFTSNTERRLYFHALNSFLEIAVPLEVVNNASLWLSASSGGIQLQNLLEQFSVIGSRGTQCESESMDSAGNLYCSLISSSALIVWKQGTKYDSDNLKVVAYNPEQLRFVTGMKINRNAAEEDELWALSSNPELFIGGNVKEGDIKFQIIGCRTRNLLDNEHCTVGTST